MSLTAPPGGGFLAAGSSFAFASFSFPPGGSPLFFGGLSEGDRPAVGVLGPRSGGGGGEGGRPFLARLLTLGLGWGAAAEAPLVGVEALLDVLALAAASAALAFFCLLSSAARLDLKVSVEGERLEGRDREREWRWRLRDRECLEDEYGLLLRDLADLLKARQRL